MPPTDPTAALRTALRSTLHELEIAHGHSSDISHPSWPACVRVHMTIDDARAALASQADDPSGPDGLDVERLARALVFRRYGIRVEEANPADIADAAAIAAEYAALPTSSEQPL